MAITEKESAEELVDRVEQTREELRSEARNRLGVTGTEEKPPPFLSLLKDRKVSIYPLAALGILSIVDTFQSYAFRVLAPEVAGALGISRATIATVIALGILASAAGTLGVVALAGQKARRALIIIITGLVWSVVAITTGYVTALAGLIAVLILDSLTTASVGTLHLPVLIDSYPPEGRVRAVSYYLGANSFGNVAAPLLVALFTTAFDFTWRGVFVALGLISLFAALTAIRLRDPGFGRWDTEQIRAAVREKEIGKSGLKEVGLSEADVTLGFFEIFRRLMLVPTVRRLWAAEIVVGIFQIPFSVFLAFFLAERWNLGPGARGLFVAYQAGAAILALAIFGKRGEAMFRRDPAKVINLAGLLTVAVVALICFAALSPNLAVTVALFGLSAALLAPLSPCINVAVLSVIPSGFRPHLGALLYVALAVGGVAGAALLGSVDSQYGITGTIVSLAIPGTIVALIFKSTAPLVVNDLDRMIDDTLEDEEIRQIAAAGKRLPMLACRKVNFSYGHVQVLFDVDFTVDDGEMVALLGTNGAGKSTLLKVVSGIGLPSGGSVRYRGADITYLDAERRLRLGITQIPGGRAVFHPMNVVENLRVFGYSIGRNRKKVDEAIERSFAAFPRLADRKNQKASTLSGGEQQMLGLAKALMLQPHLLLVDELSLGLAPVIVGQLFDMVKQINSQGTAVVVVEQSVNIALNLARHAYFMEKGQIRFDGRSEDLLARDDLLRAVFLEGAAAHTADKQS